MIGGLIYTFKVDQTAGSGNISDKGHLNWKHFLLLLFRNKHISGVFVIQITNYIRK